MSGILGIWNLDGRPVDRSELCRLSATLSHRGDDDEGVQICGAVGFASRLFRVTPEASTEVQPLTDSSGTLLVFDGRLDNRDELLSVLPRTSQTSSNSPDPALVLAAYRQFGDSFAERVNGDFALGLFDRSRSRLL